MRKNNFWKVSECIISASGTQQYLVSLIKQSMYVVLSTLYKEEMVTEHEVDIFKDNEWPWSCLVRIQCTKPADVVRRTAELLAKVLHIEKANLLKGL